MHAEPFQKLEGAWRGLNYFVKQTETSTSLKIKLMNVSKNDLLQAIPLFVYLGVTFLLFAFVTSTRDKVEMALVIGWMGPIVINPTRMLVPNHTSAIWWVELCLTLVFFVTSITVFLRLIRGQSMPGAPPDSYQAPASR